MITVICLSFFLAGCSAIMTLEPIKNSGANCILEGRYEFQIAELKVSGTPRGARRPLRAATCETN